VHDGNIRIQFTHLLESAAELLLLFGERRERPFAHFMPLLEDMVELVAGESTLSYQCDPLYRQLAV
jgi:hypothetical protein